MYFIVVHARTVNGTWHVYGLCVVLSCLPLAAAVAHHALESWREVRTLGRARPSSVIAPSCAVTFISCLPFAAPPCLSIIQSYYSIHRQNIRISVVECLKYEHSTTLGAAVARVAHSSTACRTHYGRRSAATRLFEKSTASQASIISSRQVLSRFSARKASKAVHCFHWFTKVRARLCWVFTGCYTLFGKKQQQLLSENVICLLTFIIPHI
jgi:hypothetical protein